MKKKVVAAILAVILLLGLAVCAGYRHSLLNRVNDVQPLRIMVDGTRYVVCGSVEELPDSPPDGTIRKVIDKMDRPDADGEANFGTVGMPYWYLGDKIVVKSSQYYLFNKS